jgi:hypothetical protein
MYAISLLINSIAIFRAMNIAKQKHSRGEIKGKRVSEKGQSAAMLAVIVAFIIVAIAILLPSLGGAVGGVVKVSETLEALGR